MSSQRLLKLLAFISLSATIAAIWMWRTTGAPPSPWLLRTSLVSFAGAVIVGVCAQATRPRLMLRFLAMLFSMIAVIAFAGDFAHSGPDGTVGFKATSLMGHLEEFVPLLLASAKASVSRSSSFVWDPLLTGLFGFPTFVVFGALASICGFSSRPREQVRIFIN